MSILIETEEDIRRAKLFNESLNAVWRDALNGRCTPALLNHKTVEPGKFEYVYIGWSKESERIEQKAIEGLQRLSAEDGLRKGGGEGYGYWLGAPYDACQDFHHDKSRASSAKDLDVAVKILRAAILRMETELDPDFPPIGELYFQLARCYYEHKRFEDHDLAYEKGLSFKLQNLETRPGYFGYDVANDLKHFAHSYLERDQLTQALGVYGRLKQARAMVPSAVAAVMHEDFNLLADFYERHGQVDEAAASYRSIGEQIDWTQGPDYEQQKILRESISSLMRLKKYTDAEHLYEQLLDWGLTKNCFKTESGRCWHDSPCGHWFEPYFQLLLDQNRLQHRSQVIEKLGLDEAQYLPPKPEALIGYVDLEGQWKIPQRFEDAENFSDGKAKVLVCVTEAPHARGRVIDTSGNVVGLNDGIWDGKIGESFSGLWNRRDYPVPEGYKQVERFNEGMTPVVRIEKKSTAYLGGDSTWEIGFADENGNLVIEPQFTSCRGFYRGVAIVTIGGYIGSGGGCVISLQDGKYGLIDKTGKYLIEPIYKKLKYFNQNFDDGLFIYETETDGGVITKEGEIRSVLPHCNDTFFYSDGMAAVRWGDRVEDGSAFFDQRHGYLDASGRIAIENIFDYASSFKGDRAEIRQNGKYGYINKQGEIIIDAIYESAQSFLNGIAVVKLDGKWGCINESGATVVEPNYDEIKWTKDENSPGFFEDRQDNETALLLVQKNGKFGLIDRTGKVLCAPKFDNISDFEKGTAIVTSQGLKGLLDTSGNLKMVPRFSDLKRFHEELACAATIGDDGKLLWGYIDVKGEFVIPPSFTEAEPFSNGRAAVRSASNTLWGFIMPDGSFAVEPKFDSVNSFVSERARVAFGTKESDKVFGIIDLQGKYIVEPEYEKVGRQFYDGLCLVGIRKPRRGGKNQLMKLV